MSKLVTKIQVPKCKDIELEYLRPGDVFMFNNKLHIMTSASSTPRYIKALDLEDFTIWDLQKQDIVVPVESAVLDIKK